MTSQETPSRKKTTPRKPAFGQADMKGRVSLGKGFAGALLIVEVSPDGDTVVLRRAEAVPADSAWLFKNPKAARLVQLGLEDIRQGRVDSGPDLAVGKALANKIKD